MASLPPEDTPAPPRLLAMWDSTLLAYKDRSRIIAARAIGTLAIRINGDVLPTLLVDGFVAGVWRPVEGGIEATAFHRLDDDDWAGLETRGAAADRLPRRPGAGRLPPIRALVGGPAERRGPRPRRRLTRSGSPAFVAGVPPRRTLDDMSIRPFYDRWPQYDRRLVDTIAPLTSEQLALRAAPEHWPVWAITAHIAGSRVYWLCKVIGRARHRDHAVAEAVRRGLGGRPSHPRSAAELVGALESSFAIIDRLLDAWTPEMLADPFERTIFDTPQVHSRGSILQRLMTHEAYHGGELAIALGSHGLDPVYIWRADDPLDS